MTMPEDNQNGKQPAAESRERQTLKFFFTPVDEPKADAPNPHAKAATHVPEVIEALRERFGDDVREHRSYANEDTIYVARERILDVMRFLKEEQQFNYFADCGGIDLFQDDERFEVFYNVVSMPRGKRLRVKVRVEEDNPVVPSVTSVYRAANWNEREDYDMMGIRFEGHPDPRRMYMPEDFEYYPQRKEFPQLGVPGSLPLPAQVPEGEIMMDPFPAAHGRKPPRSFQEPPSSDPDEKSR